MAGDPTQSEVVPEVILDLRAVISAATENVHADEHCLDCDRFFVIAPVRGGKGEVVRVSHGTTITEHYFDVKPEWLLGEFISDDDGFEGHLDVCADDYGEPMFRIRWI